MGLKTVGSIMCRITFLAASIFLAPLKIVNQPLPPASSSLPSLVLGLCMTAVFGKTGFLSFLALA